MVLPPPSSLPQVVAWKATTTDKKGMRILGSSIPAEDRSSNTPDIGRDVTFEKFLSAVFLLTDCGTGVIIQGYPARSAATPSLSVPSPNVPESRDAGLGGRGARCKDDQRESKP